MQHLSARRFLACVFVVLAVVPATAQTSRPALPSDALFDESVLHDIHLSINQDDWGTLKDRYLLNTYYPCHVRWNNRSVFDVGVRSRGTGSRSGTKPHLGLDFGRYIGGQTFLGLRNLVLRNNIQDPSGMRERMAMAFFRRMGEPASRQAHTRLFVNYEYVGLYTIVESIDAAYLERNFGESAGHLYSLDGGEPGYYFEYLGPDSRAYVPKPFKPETQTNDPQAEVIERMVWTINKAGDAVFRSAMAEFMDLRRFVQHLAVDMFLGETDGLLGNWGMNNTYLYRSPGANMFALLPWDKSNTFMDGPEYPIWHNVFDVEYEIQNRLAVRALGYDDLRELYLETLTKAANVAQPPVATGARVGVREGELSSASPGWLGGMVEEIYQQIRAAAYADPKTPYTVEQFEQEVQALRTFAQNRSAFVLQEVARARLPTRD